MGQRNWGHHGPSWRRSLTACCRATSSSASSSGRRADLDEWAILLRVIDLIQANAKGAELGPVLETIENALRADQAKLIESNEMGPPMGGKGNDYHRRPLSTTGITLGADPVKRRLSVRVPKQITGKRGAAGHGGTRRPLPAAASHDSRDRRGSTAN